MKTIVTLLTCLYLAACAERSAPPVQAACTIQDSVLYCSDGTSLPLASGQDGEDGQDGASGANGTNGSTATVTLFTLSDTSTCHVVGGGFSAKRFSGSETRLHANLTCTASYEALTTSNDVKWVATKSFLVYEAEAGVYTLRRVDL